MVLSLELDALMLMRPFSGTDARGLRASRLGDRCTILSGVRPKSFVAAVLVLMFASAAVPQSGLAQASQLGSPVPPGTPVTRPDGTTTTAPPPTAPTTTAPPAQVPGAYEDVTVPPPPGSAPGIRYPGVEPRQRALQTDSGVRIPSGIATRLRALDSDFQVLSLRGSSVVGGVISMLAGGLSVALGIVNDVTLGSFGAGMSPYLYVYGGSGLVRGVLELALMTNASGPAITFAHMPMTTMEEVQARLDYGERELSTLAERAMISRILDGSLSIATGLAIIPIMFAGDDEPFGAANLPFAIIAIATASISTISGVITLIQTTEAERRWSAYQELRDRLAARGDADAREREQMRRSREEAEDEASLEHVPGGTAASFTGLGVAGTF